MNATDQKIEEKKKTIREFLQKKEATHLCFVTVADEEAADGTSTYVEHFNQQMFTSLKELYNRYGVDGFLSRLSEYPELEGLDEDIPFEYRVLDVTFDNEPKHSCRYTRHYLVNNELKTESATLYLSTKIYVELLFIGIMMGGLPFNRMEKYDGCMYDYLKRRIDEDAFDEDGHNLADSYPFLVTLDGPEADLKELMTTGLPV